MRKFHLGTLCSEKGSATVRDGIKLYQILLVWPEVLSVDDIVRSFISILLLVVLFLACPENGGLRLLQSGWYSTFNDYIQLGSMIHSFVFILKVELLTFIINT